MRVCLAARQRSQQAWDRALQLCTAYGALLHDTVEQGMAQQGASWYSRAQH